MPTVVKKMRTRDLPDDWQADFAPDALVEVRLCTASEESADDQRARLKQIIDGIKPVKPKAGYRGSVETLQHMREERSSQILGQE